MCILGAIYLERIVVQPLTEYMWLGLHPQDGARLKHLTRVLDSLSRALNQLTSVYREYAGASLEPDSSRFFPRVRHYYDKQGNRVQFTYSGHLVGRRPVFTAFTKHGHSIVVKFVRQYNSEAHELLTTANLAPQLLFDGSDDTHVDFPRPAGMRMIVMDYVSGTNLLDSVAKNLALGSVKEDVKQALKILHAQDLVFGDLREPNVLVVQKDDQSVRGMLVDFDWCGKHTIARYPTSMNSDIQWPPGVKKGSVMDKGHDNHMFEEMFGPANL